LQRHVFRDVPRVAVPGYDVVGRVESVGPGVTDFVRGERIAAFVEYGGYARHALVSADHAVRVSANVEPSSAAAVVLNYPAAFALLGTQRLGIGQWVVIHSATGGVGSALVDVARSRGLRVAATARNASVEGWPRDVPLLETADPSLVARLREIT